MIRIMLFMLVANFAIGQSSELKDFSALRVNGDIKIKLIKSESNKINITVSSGSEKDISVDVVAGELNIKNKAYGGKSRTKANITLYYKYIDQITAGSGCNIKGENTIDAKTMELSASSGSTIWLEIKGTKAKIDASSGSNITVIGSIDSATFRATSGSNINGQELSSAKVEAVANSGSNVKVWSLESLTADGSSGGTVLYRGSPKDLNIKNGYTGGSVKSMGY